MSFPRSSGILLHPTSLPGSHGIGELGGEAHRFADFLKDAGQTIWQVLPLGPTGYGDSPYQCFSAFAGQPAAYQHRFAGETRLSRAPMISNPQPKFPRESVDFGTLIRLETAAAEKGRRGISPRRQTAA